MTMNNQSLQPFRILHQRLPGMNNHIEQTARKIPKVEIVVILGIIAVLLGLNLLLFKRKEL